MKQPSLAQPIEQNLRQDRRTLLVLVVALVLAPYLLASGAPSSADNPSAREYHISGHGGLLLSVPLSWREATYQPSMNLPPTIIYRPDEGEHFVVVVAVVWGRRNDRDFNSPARVRALIERDRDTMLPFALEGELPLQFLSGDDAYGYYFMATYKDSHSTDPPYLMKAGVATGQLLLDVTFWSYEQDPAVVENILLMLREAYHEEF